MTTDRAPARRGAITVVIADDEAPARARLATLLAGEPDFDVVATCASGREAVSSVTALEPDVLFLDIRMPGLDGFDVVRRLSRGPAPLVVFVTAFDEFAISAFEANAVDYLLKPFSRKRFSATLTRLRGRLAEAEHRDDVERRLAEVVRAVLERTGKGASRDARIPVRENRRTTFVRPEEIVWLEARRNYVRVHTPQRRPLLRSTLGALVDRLGPEFVRIHRSWAIHVGAVEEVRSRVSGGFEVLMSDGTRLPSSERYEDAIRRILTF